MYCSRTRRGREGPGHSPASTMALTPVRSGACERATYRMYRPIAMISEPWTRQGSVVTQRLPSIGPHLIVCVRCTSTTDDKDKMQQQPNPATTATGGGGAYDGDDGGDDDTTAST